MGLLPKSRGAASPRGSWAYGCRVAGVAGVEGLPSPRFRSPIFGGAARGDEQDGEGGSRAPTRTVPKTPRSSSRHRRTG